jgi:hypothetical protein
MGLVAWLMGRVERQRLRALWVAEWELREAQVALLAWVES